jgi:hypothetical protein
MGSYAAMAQSEATKNASAGHADTDGRRSNNDGSNVHDGDQMNA